MKEFRILNEAVILCVWTSLGKGCRMYLWMLALRSNLEEPGHAVLLGGNDRQRGEEQVLKRRGQQ